MTSKIKVASIFFNGNHFLLHNLVADLESFPKHCNDTSFD